MARKTIDHATVLRIAVEVGCNEHTVRRVFRDKSPEGYQVSRRIFAVLVREGFLDPVNEDVSNDE